MRRFIDHILSEFFDPDPSDRLRYLEFKAEAGRAAMFALAHSQQPRRPVQGAHSSLTRLDRIRLGLMK